MHKFTVEGFSTTIVENRFDLIDQSSNLVDGAFLPIEGDDSDPIAFQTAAHFAFANEVARLLKTVQFLRDAGLLQSNDLASLVKPLTSGLKKPETIYIE